MKRILIIFFIFLSLPVLGQRQSISIDNGWQFHLGNIESDAQWTPVQLPHDWSAEGTFSKDAPGGGSEAFLPAGTGTYRYEFDSQPSWRGKRVSVQFDGIYCNASVYINGQLLGKRPNGYLGQTYDLTAMLKPKSNVLTVFVDNSLQPSSRWYSGSGINRHARLLVTGNVFVPVDGTYVTTPQVSETEATVRVSTEVVSVLAKTGTAFLRHSILDREGKCIAKSGKKRLALPAGDSATLTIVDSLALDKPSLWSTDSPALYTLKTEIFLGSELVDLYCTKFGVRSISFDANDGFLLNGKKERFKGVCLHQNTGPVGSAMPDELWLKRLKQLKEMGCNAVRTSHYAYAPVFYELCDSLGIMVMDELFDGWDQWKGSGKAKYDYGYYFKDWWRKDLEAFVKRDRNHPSIMIWSLGNEVWGWENHLDLQADICELFHKLDPTRPTTQAWCTGDIPDIVGFNGNGEQIDDIEGFHREHPQRVAVGTEMPHTRSTRGVYQTQGSFKIWEKPPVLKSEELARRFPLESYADKEVFTSFDPRYGSSYDNQARWITIRTLWNRTKDLSYYVGDFRWAGYDYLGEAWGWPSRTNNYGVIDMCGFPKDNYYLYQSIWSDKPMVHLLPHWSWPGMEGTVIPVVAYTNGDEVELFQDGCSLGRKKMSKDSLEVVWNVPYKPGELKAVSYLNGERHAEDRVVSAGEPYALKLSTDKIVACANMKDLICIIVDVTDNEGNPVPFASNLFNVELEGPCRLLGIENGDILDMTQMKSLSRKVFMGRALIMLQTTEVAGEEKVIVSACGLQPATVKIPIKNR